jgi:hypothetical protein
MICLGYNNETYFLIDSISFVCFLFKKLTNISEVKESLYDQEDGGRIHISTNVLLFVENKMQDSFMSCCITRPLLGDEGSGYAIGSDLLNAVVRAVV